MTRNGAEAAKRAMDAATVRDGAPPRFKSTLTIEAGQDPSRPVVLTYYEEPGGIRDECRPSTVEQLHGWLQQKLSRGLWGVESVKALRIFGKGSRNHGD